MSEGRDPSVLATLAASSRPSLLDLHADPDHHRAVLTLGGEPGELLGALHRLALATIGLVDLRSHEGVHPRIGALDVVPFAPPASGPLETALVAREAALSLLAALGLPCFRYGPLPDGSVRTLPEVRRDAFARLAPDAGPADPHPTAGAVAVGARQPLLAWNVWLSGASLDGTRRLAASLRSEVVRTLGLPVSGGTQVSCNLLDPAKVTPLEVLERLRGDLPEGAAVQRCELVGLAPDDVLAAVPPERWAEVGLREEARISRALDAPARD